MSAIPNTNPSLNLELTLFEVNYLIMALQEMPARYANPLTAKISNQAKVQLGLFNQVVADANDAINKFKKSP